MDTLFSKHIAPRAGGSLRTWRLQVALLAVVMAEVAAVMACDLPVAASPEADVPPWPERQGSLAEPPQGFQPAS